MLVFLSGEILISGEGKNWIGAWWLGYIIIGILVILSSIPLFWFPQSLPSEPVGGNVSMQFCGKLPNLMLIWVRSCWVIRPLLGNKKGEDETPTKFRHKEESLSKIHCGKLIYFLKSKTAIDWSYEVLEGPGYEGFICRLDNRFMTTAFTLLVFKERSVWVTFLNMNLRLDFSIAMESDLKLVVVFEYRLYKKNAQPFCRYSNPIHLSLIFEH